MLIKFPPLLQPLFGLIYERCGFCIRRSSLSTFYRCFRIRAHALLDPVICSISNVTSSPAGKVKLINVIFRS